MTHHRQSWPRHTFWMVLLGLVPLALLSCRDAPLPMELNSATSAGLAAATATFRPAAQPVPDQYIVVFRPGTTDVPGLADQMVQAHGGSRLHVYEHALEGFAARLPARAIPALLENPQVLFIEEDGYVELDLTTQPNAPWAIDRIDQRDLPLSTTYSYGATGAGVNVYVIDSGIRYSHNEFEGRASLGVDLVGDGVGAGVGACLFHGTFVSALAGGKTYGAAKQANLVSVRVFGCEWEAPRSRIIAGIDWVTANAVRPAVVNMSLGETNEAYPGLSSLDLAVENSIATGLPYTVSAGNLNDDACRRSPARAPSALTAAATTSSDARWAESNFGSCVDLFAPGHNVTSAVHTSDTAVMTNSGTSAAAPHVAGVAAMYLQSNPDASPAAIREVVVSTTSGGRLSGIGAGSPNRLLYSLLEPPSGGAPFHTIKDEFAGTEIDTELWTFAGVESWVSQDDRLIVGPPPHTPGFGGMHFRLPAALTGSSLTAEISQAAAGSATTETYLSVILLDTEEFIIVSSLSGVLQAWYKERGTGVRQLGNSVAFNPVNHRFRRIRETNGTLFVEVSANGQNWSRPSGWQVANFFTTPGALYANLGVRERSSVVGNPTPAIFENVNTTVPAIPSGLAASTVSTSRIDLSWQDRSVNEQGFRIERRVAGEEAFVQIAQVGANATSYQNTGLQPSTTYEYRVRAYNASGNSAYSNTASATTQSPTGPPPPDFHTLVDDFAGTTVRTTDWNYYQLPARTQQNDRLIVTLTPGVAGYGGLIYKLPHRFLNSSFTVEVSQVAAGGPLTETGVGVTSLDEEEYVVITSLNGKIGAYAKWRGEGWFRFRLGEELPYDPVAHRFRRIRENNGTIHYELSPNGTNWTQPLGWSVQHGFSNLDDLHGMLGAGAFVADPNAGTAVFENVNTTVPAIPSGLAASPVSTNRIDLSWQDRSVNEQGFRIERRVAGEPTFVQIAQVGANVTSYQNTGLQPSTTYEYRVRAYNASGNSAYSNIASATTPGPINQPPVADAGGPYSGNEGSSIQFNGSGSFDPDGDPLTYAWNFGDGGTGTGVSPTRSYVDNGTYLVILTVTDSHGATSAPDTTTATIANVPPSVNLSLSAGTVQVGQSVGFTGSFSDPGVQDGPWQWQIEWGDGTVGNGSAPVQGQPITGNHAFSQAGSYTVRFRVTDKDGGVGTAQQPLTVQVLPVPNPPSNLSAASISASRIDLSWQDNSDNEQGFEIQRRQGQGAWTTIHTTGPNVTSFSNTNLPEATTYTYRVRAFNANGSSAWSNEATGVTRPAAPTNLVAVAISSSQIRLTWQDNSNGEQGYEIYRVTSRGAPTLIGTVEPNVTTFIDSGLAPGSTHFYGVAAFNAGGQSEPSNPAGATTPSQ